MFVMKKGKKKMVWLEEVFLCDDQTENPTSKDYYNLQKKKEHN